MSSSKTLISLLKTIYWGIAGLSVRGGAGDFPSYYECGLRQLSWENIRKIEPKEICSCFIPHLLVVFTGQLEILVTPLGILGCFVLQHGYGLVLFH